MAQEMARIERPGRRAVLWIGVWALLAQVVGSLFNIWYNLIHIQPLLTRDQLAAFVRAIHQVNLFVYPVGAVILAMLLLHLQSVYGRCWRGLPVDPRQLLRTQRRAINLGWWVTGIAAPCWLVCIPWLLLALPAPVDGRVYFHLPVSIGVATLISQTLTMFAVEIVSQRCLYPVLFPDTPPSRLTGTYPLSLRGRALLVSLAASICPILSLLLLVLSPQPDRPQNQWFAVGVALFSAALAVLSVGLVSHLIEQPVLALRKASRRVTEGDLETRVNMLRADEFGPLIEEFNAMVDGLSQKAHIEESFGRHVGRQTAQAILARGHNGLSGEEMDISVMFVDIRGFTTRCSGISPGEAVALLNVFFTAMVEVIEAHGGMVNKFLGDGLMALFGIAVGESDHADRAVASGVAQLERLRTLNAELAHPLPIKIGIGIHSGPAVVGSIGAPQRMEYTAIGDTVNVASRIESLTKDVGHELLLSDATLRRLTNPEPALELPPQPVKGKAELIRIYGWRSA